MKGIPCFSRSAWMENVASARLPYTNIWENFKGRNFISFKVKSLVSIHSACPCKNYVPKYSQTPHAQGVKQLVCPSVVVVGTKIARSRVLGICACYKHNQSVDIGEKLVCTRFKLLDKAYWCYKWCIFCSSCLWFIDCTHSFSMLMRPRMLKLSIGKGRQVRKQLCRRSECCSTTLQWLQSAQGMYSTEL